MIDEARARAVRRVESAVRHVHAVKAQPRTESRGPERLDSLDGADLKTQVIPAITDAEAPDAVPEPEQVIAREIDEPPAAGPVPDEVATAQDEPEPAERRHRESGEVTGPPPPGPVEQIPDTARTIESDDERLQRLLAFMVHQEPRLNWAIGDRADGATVLVTDLAHGWIPPGIALPAGVRLLAPGRRSGRVSALLGESRRTRSYAPGDALGWLDDFSDTKSSGQPRELPALDDLGWELSQATHWRDGLPRMVHTLARAAAAGTGVAEEEIDLLRVHLDTARYQLLTQYPNIDAALLLNCLLLAATEGEVTGDLVSANYHLAWFRELSAPKDGV